MMGLRWERPKQGPGCIWIFLVSHDLHTHSDGCSEPIACLIGASVLVVLGVVGFPLLFDTQPRPVSVDIAVDISGTMRDARPGILAYRPAPVQVNWLAYPGTSGAPWIDVDDPAMLALAQVMAPAILGRGAAQPISHQVAA